MDLGGRPKDCNCCLVGTVPSNGPCIYRRSHLVGFAFCPRCPGGPNLMGLFLGGRPEDCNCNNLFGEQTLGLHCAGSSAWPRVPMGLLSSFVLFVWGADPRTAVLLAWAPSPVSFPFVTGGPTW